MDSVIATGLATQDAGVDSFAEAAARAALGLGGAPVDLALVFAGMDNLDQVEDGLAAVQERLRPQRAGGLRRPGRGGRRAASSSTGAWRSGRRRFPAASWRPFT